MRKGQAIPNIPPGYDSVHEVAEREGQSVQVLKRRCRRYLQISPLVRIVDCELKL